MRQKEKPVNSFKFELESRSINESLARSCIAALIAQLDPTVDELGRYPDRRIRGGHQLHCARLSRPAREDLHIRRPLPGRTGSHPGEGQGLRDFRRAARDGAAFTTGNTEERSGLGFSVMQSMMDRICGKIETGRPDRRHPRKEAAIER